MRPGWKQIVQDRLVQRLSKRIRIVNTPTKYWVGILFSVISKGIGIRKPILVGNTFQILSFSDTLKRIALRRAES